MTCVLFSGGWDSAACVLLSREQKPDLLFFKYGQLYQENELDAALNFAHSMNLNLIVKNIDLTHDHPRRNFYLIAEAKRLGYSHIVFGSRNLLPVMDKYKDSNYAALKAFGALMGLKLDLPLTGWLKTRVIKYVRRHYDGALYNCYANKTDISLCSCPNCKQLSRIFNALR